MIPVLQPGPTFLQVSGQYIALIQSPFLLTQGTKIKNKNMQKTVLSFVSFGVGSPRYNPLFAKPYTERRVFKEVTNEASENIQLVRHRPGPEWAT